MCGLTVCEPNKSVVMDNHPLPHTDDLFSEMRGATVFSTIDHGECLLLSVTGRRKSGHDCIHNTKDFSGSVGFHMDCASLQVHSPS